MSTLKRVAANSFLYTASSILLRASSLIFFPIFSLYLTKSDYGILSITQSIGGFVTLFAGLELSKALTRFIFNNNHESSSHDKLIYTTLSSSFLFGSLLVLIFYIIGPFVLKPILNDIPFFPYIFVFLLSIPFNAIVDTCRVYQKATHQGFNAFLLDTSFFSINIILNLVFVVVLKMDVLGIFLGTLLNTILFSLILYFVFYRKFKFGIDIIVFKNVLKYALPLIPYALLNILFDSIDKFFLNADSGAKTSGIYYIALTFAAIFSTAKESVVNAFTPWLFANIKQRDESYLADIINVIFAGLGIAAIGVAWFSKEVLMLLSSNPDFVEAYRFIPFTVMGLYIIFLGQLYNMKTFYFGKYNRYLFLATLAGIAADIVACYLLVKPYGIHGAVFSRVIAFTVHVAVLMYLSTLETEKRNIYEGKKLVLTMLILCAFMPVPLLIGQGYIFILLKIVAYVLIAVLFTYYINLKFNLVEGLKKYKAIR